MALALDGEVLVHEAFGDADLDTRFTIFSATKPFIASLVWQLLGEGALTPEQPVADLIPEFGSNGKDAITLDHVLQHTAGFPHAPLGPPQWDTHEGRRAGVRRVAAQLAGRLAVRVPPHLRALGAGRDRARRHRPGPHRRAPRAACSSRSASPASCSGPPPDEQTGIADLVLVGEPATPDELEAALGIREIPVGEVTDEALMNLNTPAARAVGLPGGGGISNAADVTLFYQALLHDPKGLWDPEVLDDVTSVVRNTFPDPMLGHPANRTRGPDRRRRRRALEPAGHGPHGVARPPSATTAPPVRSPGPIPPPGCRSATSPTAATCNVLREHRRTTAVASLAAVCAA